MISSAGRRIVAGFVLVIVVLVVMSVISYRSTLTSLRTAERVNESYEVLEDVQRLATHLVDAETGQRGYLLTRDARYLRPYESATAALEEDLKALRASLQGRSAHAAKLQTLEDLVGRKREELARTVQAATLAGPEAATDIVRSGEGRALMTEIRATLADIDAVERNQLQQRSVEADQSARWTRWSVLGLGGGMVVVLVLLAVFSLRTIETDNARRDRAEASARRQAERLTALREVDRAILAAHSPEAVAGVALSHLRGLIRSPRAAVALYDVVTGEGTWIAVDDAQPTERKAGRRFPLQLMGDLAALRRGEVQILDTASLGHLEAARVAAAEGVRSYAVVPLVTEGELLGSLNFVSPAPGGVTADDVEIAQQVADLLAVGIQQARLRNRIERHAEELEDRVAARTRELTVARAAVEQASQAKTEFLSRMSHELRTPLNAILGFGQLLELGPTRPEDRESVDHILRAGRHLVGLIDEILDISRIEAGRLPLSLEPVEVREAVSRVLEILRPMAAGQDVRLEAELPAAMGPHVLADRLRLQQVLLNLVSNAIKYNRPGGRVTVTVTVPEPGRLRIVVTDTGFGLSPQEQARLFVPFERLSADRTRIEGTGLGLALSRRLAEAMAGTLGVESAPGQGSTFWVDLPETAAPSSTVESGTGDGAGQAGPGRRGVVLYIEDNPSNLRLAERVIGERPAVRFLSAMQGRLGLDLARQHRPDLILLDLHLPDVPGETVLREVRGDPALCATPVVVLSADATPGQVRRLLAAGASEYLTKPLDVRRVLALLDETLGTARS